MVPSGYVRDNVRSLLDSGCIQGKYTGPLLVHQDYSHAIVFFQQFQKGADPGLRRPTRPRRQLYLELTLPPESLSRIAKDHEPFAFRSVAFKEIQYSIPLGFKPRPLAVMRFRFLFSELAQLILDSGFEASIQVCGL